MILYIIKANLILALLCLLFQVLMHRDTFFGVRRLMLWGIYATAFLLPLLNVQEWLAGDTAAYGMTEAYAQHVLPTLNVTAMRVASFGVEQEEPGCGMWFVGMMALWALIYIIPVVWLSVKLFMQVAYIIYLRCTCPLITQLPSPFGEGAGVRRFPRPCTPFSFGSWIFLHPDGMDEQTLREVLIHEQTHIRGWHTIDILFSQLVCILFWWNPAAWVMRREVRLNLEFIADATVIGRQKDKREYQYRLLGFSTYKNVATIANNFNVLPLKRRITMMNLRRTRRTGMVKYALFVPAAAALLFACNLDSLARTIAETVKKPLMIVDGQRISEAEVQTLLPEQIDHVTVFKEKSAKAVYGEEAKDGAVIIEKKKDTERPQALLLADKTASKVATADEMASTVARVEAENDIYAEAEQMPQFPGGEAAFIQYIAQHVRYPLAAAKNGIKGTVTVQFIVETDGRITHVQAINSPSEEFDAEVYTYGASDKQPSQDEEDEGHRALREAAEELYRGMPPFEPGLQNGKPVRVRMTRSVRYY